MRETSLFNKYRGVLRGKGGGGNNVHPLTEQHCGKPMNKITCIFY